MTLVFCSRCETRKAEGEFYPSALQGRFKHGPWCKDCTRAYYRARVATDPNYFLKYQRRLRRLKLRRVSEERTRRGCMDCSERHPACLDFHHRDKDQKRAPISQLAVENASWKRIESEIEKCDVLCSNCHRKRHFDAVTGRWQFHSNQRV